MNDKLYIKKLIRDDGETLAFDGKEIYLAERNTLLVRPDPRTAAVDYTEADGGEMIHQQNQTYPQTISGLIVPKTTDYWQLVNKLSAFFKIKHNYKIIYQKRSGEMFMIQGAWISAGLQIIPRPHEDYSEWDITLTVGNLTWVEYMENSAGEQIYPNTVTLSLITIASGGEVWDSVGAEWDNYVGKNLLTSSVDAITQRSRAVATESGNGFIVTSTESSGACYVVISIQNVADLLGKQVTLSYNGSGDGVAVRFYYLNASNTAQSPVRAAIASGESFTMPTTLGSYTGIGAVFYTSNGGNATYNDIQLELGSTATSYEPYGAGGGEVWEVGGGGVEDINISSSQTIYPVWTVKGPCVNPRLQNNTTDSLAEFDGTLTEGQTLVVDFAEGTAYLDNALVTRLLSGEVSFAPGENVVGFSSDGGATTTSTISWANIIN